MRRLATRLAGVSLLAVLVWVGWSVGTAERQSVERAGAVTAVAEFERSGANYKGFERGEALITVEELSDRIRTDASNLVLLALRCGSAGTPNDYSPNKFSSLHLFSPQTAIGRPRIQARSGAAL